MSIIDFRDVTYTYPEATSPALENLTIQIYEGDFILVMGLSGSGKSTLLRCINGLVPHFSGGTLKGKLRVHELDPVHASPRMMSQYVGFVFQDPETQFVMDVVEDEIAFALENAALDPQEMRVRVEEVLDLLDLAPLRRRRLETLSGGERQRVAIASALALRPNILVLDEPTSQLDPKSAEDVLTILVRLNQDLGLTVILAEHRLERVLPFVDEIIYLPDQGEPALQDIPEAVLTRVKLGPPLVILAKELGWRPLPLTIKAGRRFSRRWSAAQADIHDGRTEIASARVSSSAPKQVYLQASQLQIRYGQTVVIKNLGLSLHSGEIMVLMGRNGSGKTTLLKTLVGLMKPQSGQIWVKGEDVTNDPVAERARQVAYLPQDPNALLFADTVLDELMITLLNHHYDDPKDWPISPQTLLDDLKLAGKIQAYPRDLSVGERQRVALGSIMITKPGALLLDEPTRGLDYEAKARLVELLTRWRDEGMAVLLVTHDVEFAASLADHVLLLSQGEIIASGHPADVLGSSPLFAPQIARLFPKTPWLTVGDVFNFTGNLSSG